MKFCAVMYEQQHMKEFLNIILTLSKLTKECVMIISSDKVHFIINEESTSTAPLVWTEIQSNHYFDQYRMDGINDKYPNILLSLNPTNFSRALSILRNPVKFVKFKLTNQQFPCITIIIELSSNITIQDRRIIHHLPIDLIPIRDWDLYKIPKVLDSEIILKMPTLKCIRNLIDKTKNLAPSLTFCLTNAGILAIIGETDVITVASHCNNLEIKKLNKNNQSDNDDNNNDDDENFEVSCLVDGKKIAIFLSALQINNSELSCGIVQDHAIEIDVEVQFGINMRCIIPAVCV